MVIVAKCVLGNILLRLIEFVVVVVLQHKIGWYWDILCVESKFEGRFSKTTLAAVTVGKGEWKLVVAREIVSEPQE